MSTQKPQPNPEESKDQLSETDLGAVSGGLIGAQQTTQASSENLATSDALARMQANAEKAAQNEAALYEIRKSLTTYWP